MELGMLIQQKRRQAGLTIDELSERSGVPKGTLNKILNGITRDPQLETVKALARALGCTLEDFDDSPRPRALTQPEFDLIQKYRKLDSHSRRLVELVIDQELRRGQVSG
ncbi:helix-turn-helix transcriptional regulator [uncultured Gemmiger sp.]|uniref:helix-turn-helix domain-containing protein n=1 Tax=uncultured Gemmiger sp. TaxID=1623490 RepID=UPI0025F09DDB|nr:helix-turn-helix transcriptional regulator [uncultured Gemmiger sp.]